MYNFKNYAHKFIFEKENYDIMFCMEDKMNRRYIVSRKVLILWTLFVGIGALAGSLMMLIDPSGKLIKMDAMLPYFQVLPFASTLFQNLIFSGIMLLLVNGITNIIASVFLFLNKKVGIVLGMTFGITLMMWIVIQFIIFPFNLMSTLFFIIGFFQFITGFTCLVGYKQSVFSFNKDEYDKIGNNPTKIVVFFSRTGYTKKLAYEIAQKQEAEIFEIKTTEKIKGNLGFWWCGRFGMHKWGMPLEKMDIDFSKYEHVTICSPTWVFGLSSPVREFCKQNHNKIQNASYVLTHFMGCRFNKIAKEMDNLLNIEHLSFHSYKCRFGKFREIK